MQLLPLDRQSLDADGAKDCSLQSSQTCKCCLLLDCDTQIAETMQQQAALTSLEGLQPTWLTMLELEPIRCGEA
jgi:hypothetical protein